MSATQYRHVSDRSRNHVLCIYHHFGVDYYGERCLVYLTGTTKWIKPYKIIYIAAIALAPFLSLEPIWLLADITNALMIIPNLIAIIALRKVIIGETKLYFSKQNEEKMSAAVKAVE